MHSLTAVASLLAAAATPAMLATLAVELGFATPPLSLDHEALHALGLGEAPVLSARIVAGRGALRALLVETHAATPLRDTVATLARRLSATAPQLLWLLVAAERGGHGLALATWSAGELRPRIAALLVDRTQVLASDAETFASLADAGSESDVLTHANWLELLGREALTRRFYRTLERVVGELATSARGHASAEERNELALLCLSRLLFLSFVESRGWLDGNRRFLAHGFAQCMERGGDYHRRTLDPLFFGTLNTPLRARAAAARAFGRVPFLNGGLFARTALERRRRDLRFSDESLGLLYGELLTRYRFTAREETSAWSEAAVDPEMLGKAFESLMSTRARRSSGSFYTPQPLVARITQGALVEALATNPTLDGRGRPAAACAGESDEAPGGASDGASSGASSGVLGAASSAAVAAALHGEAIEPRTARALRARVQQLRILDPACGSGAFLVHALEELSALLARAGDRRPTAAIRRELLTRSIFGVDVNPIAVWLCELRLWLSVLIEGTEIDPLAVPPLPNLDRHIRLGDALSGDGIADGRPPRGGTARLTVLRDRYARAAGARKHTLERALDRAERAAALAHVDADLVRCAHRRRDLISTLRGRDLFGERVRAAAAERDALARERAAARALRLRRRVIRDGGALPFAWVTHFPDAARAGGFDVVIGNPPWVRLHHIPLATRAALRTRYVVFRHASWERGAALAHAGRGFAAQVDLAALFAERSLALLRDGGTLALLLPAKLWRSLAGGGVRRLLAGHTQIVALEDWSASSTSFDAAVYPSVLVARASHTVHAAGAASVPACPPTPPPRAITAAAHHRSGTLSWQLDPSALALDDDPASPWIPIPPPVRTAFDRIACAGSPLGESALGSPRLGVKCGCNDAFVVEWPGGGDELVTVRAAGGRTGTLERAVLRPVLRGETTTPWCPATGTEWIVWTHDELGAPLPRRALPRHTARWLERWHPRLAARADVRRGTPWWSLFRTAAASASSTRVVWADVGRTPRALVLPAGDCTVPLNSCYVLPCGDPRDAYALAALLNSPVAAAWLHVLAEPARGDYHRYLAWTVALLPIPRDWPRARTILAELGEQAANGDAPTSRQLTTAVLGAYRVRAADAAPLLAWCER